MGGIGTVFGDLARSAVSKIAPSLGKEVDAAEMSANDVVGAKDAYFKVGGALGEKVKQLHMTYQVERAKAQAQLDAPVNTLQKQVLEHPTLRKNGLNVPLRDLHTQATAAGHTMAQPGSELHALMQRSAHAPEMTLNQIKNQNVQQARTLASAKAFGPKMENVIPYVMPLLKSNNPLEESWAKGVMNLISNETRDTTKIFQDGEERQVSAAKKSVADAVGKENKKTYLKAKAAGLNTKGLDYIPAFETSPTYKAPGIWERRVQNVLRVAQLPMVALKHISTIGNLSSIHAPQLAHGLLQMSDPQFKAFLDSTHILAYTNHDFMDRAMRGGSGLTARLTGNPTAGQIFFGAYHMPLFDFVRSKQLSYAASVGWSSAHNWAAQAAKGSKIAIANLKEMGIDPAAVVKQGGVLTKDQLTAGVFHFVNNRFFLDKTIEQSLKATSSMLWRSATMYHTFVNAQGRFFRRELAKMVQARDYVGIAQFAGTIGVLWPAVAPMIKSLEVFGRTLNPKEAVQSAQDDYGKLTNFSNPKAAASAYLNMLSYYAAYGVYTNYIQAAHGNRLMYALAGPSIGVPARLTEDGLNFFTRANSAGKHNAAPIVRDMLEDFVPIAGNQIAHHIAPTAAEQRLGTGKKVQRGLRRARISPDAKWEF